jgi:AraC-like DNA-binding protein
MRAAGSIKKFQQTPVGYWVAGRNFLVWNFSPKLGGAVLWGRPTETDLERMFSLTDAYHRDAPACDIVTDVSRVESIEGTAYGTLIRLGRERLGFFSSTSRRHAIIRTEGLVGALAEGFFPLLGARHSWKIFENHDTAFRWVAQPEGVKAWSELEPLIDQASGMKPELRQLRDYLRTRLQSARFADAAYALGMSQRTLHRTLLAAGTGFRDELNALRVDVARRMLVETDYKIENIAHRVGCSSHAHLATLFRRNTGQTPSDYREQVRATLAAKGDASSAPPHRPRRRARASAT